MKKPFKIAFITSENPLDKKSWSGIPFFMFKVLSENFEKVEAIGPINKWVVKSFSVVNKITRFFLNKGYNHKNAILPSLILGKIIENRLKKQNYDFIFAPAASTEIAFLKTNTPIFLTSDSSFGQLNEYYDTYSNLFHFSKLESNYIEQKSLAKASLLTYPSNWALDFINKKYKTKAQATVLPYGANIDAQKINYKSKSISKSETINLLFLGVDWERKGGDLVYKTFIELKREFNVTLTVCGCIPSILDKDVIIIPYLDKNKEQDYIKLDHLFQQAHFLFLPSKSECFGIVFCEASAYGVPCISRKTGGIEGAIINNVNGYCLDSHSSYLDYVKLLSDLINNPLDYLKLSLSSRKLYLEKLNWDTWGENVSKQITDYLIKQNELRK